MELLFVAVFTLYIALLIVLIKGWDKAVAKRTTSAETSKPKISVVVAVRNESNHVVNLIAQLRELEYANFEIIFVDDHSTDDTVSLIRSGSVDHFKVIENPGSGKKAALTAGIHQASGDIIATTDADCELPKNWLHCIHASLSNHEIKFSFGAVKISSDGSFFSRLQALEFSSLIGSGAALAALGKPIMCNGANLAYRREVFLEVNGFEGNLDVASGDDEFLMRKVHEKYPQGISFDHAVDRMVTTAPANSVRTFIQQRIRWASKWKRNTSFTAVTVALFMLSMQVATIGLLIFALLDANVFIISLLLLKVLIEGFFLFRVCRFLRVGWDTFTFLALQFVYPFYVLAIGMMSNFLSFEWKERRIGRKFQVARSRGGVERSAR